MSFDSLWPGPPWSPNQTGTAHRLPSSPLWSSRSLIKLSVDDSGTLSVFGFHLASPNNIKSNSPRGVQARIIPAAKSSHVTLSSPPDILCECSCVGRCILKAEVFSESHSPSTVIELFCGLI